MIRESSHAASLRRKLIAIGKLTLPTNSRSSSSSSLTPLTTEQKAPSPSLVCSPLSYAHPSMCATGIPDMGGGLGVVAINHNLDSNDNVDDNISNKIVTSEAGGISSQASIMRVPVRGVVTGKSARRWIYQMILEASTHPKKNEEKVTVTHQVNVEPAFPLLFECLRSYLVKGGNAPTTGGKESQLPTNSPLTIKPVSVNLEEKISNNATSARNEKLQLLRFLTRLEEWLLSLTSVQTIALFLFLMREVPAKYFDQITATSESGIDNKSENPRGEDNEEKEVDAGGKNNSPLPYVIAEDPERHALLWEWVRNLPSQYDNLLELVVDSETTESDAGRSIDHFVWSPDYAAKVRKEIAAWHALFLSTMMRTTTTTQELGTATCKSDDDDDASSGEEILTSDEEDDDRTAAKSGLNKLKNKPKCTDTYEPQSNTSMPVAAASGKINTTNTTPYLDEATTPFVSFSDMLQSFFAIRPDLLENLVETKDKSNGINGTGSGEGCCRLGLTICPQKFLWAYNSLMSRGFACDDEIWVMMPFVDYFNYGFAEDETDEDDAIRYCKEEMKAKTKSAEKLKESAVGTRGNNAANVDSAQAKTTATNTELDAIGDEVTNQSGRPAPHLCSNISVIDRIPSAEELLDWIYSSSNSINTSTSSSLLTSTPRVLPTSLSEVERLLDWSANAFSSTKLLWDLGAGTRYKALSSSRKLRGEYLKQQVDGVLGTSGLNGSIKALESGDDTFSSFALLSNNSTGGAQETLTWYQQAKKITAATAIIVPSYNPLSICEFTTTADVPFTNSLVAKGQQYHQFLLCYGTYMDQELALWYGFTLTAPGDEKVIVDPDACRGDVHRSAVLPQARTPQPLLRNHIGHSYSFSPLADACGDYPSDRPEQSYRRVAERFFASPLMMGAPNAEMSTTLVTSEVIEKSLADFKESFKPYVCGGSSSSSKRGIRRGGGKGDYFVVGDGVYTDRDDGSEKRSLHSLRKGLSNTSGAYSSSHLTRLSSPHLFFSSTGDVFRNHFSDYRISKAGVTEEILEVIEHLSVQYFAFSDTHSCDSLEVHLLRKTWAALLGSCGVTPQSCLEGNAVLLISELSEYQRVFNNRCGTYAGAPSSTNTRVRVVPAPKRSRESPFGQKARERKEKSRSLCGADACESEDTICVSLSELVSVLSRQIPSFSPSVLLVALVLQNVAFSEWELLEKSRMAFIASNRKNTERNGSPHSTMAEYFGVRASHVQWEMLSDISNMHANAQRTPVCEDNKSTTMPLISLDHLMNLLYLCYDGRGRD